VFRCVLAAPPSSERLPLLRIPVLTDRAANLLERLVGRQPFERGADLLDDGIESFHFARPVDDHREDETSVDDEGRISGNEPHRLDFGLELGRLLLLELGVRTQLFAAQASHLATRRFKPLEFEAEQRV
jgi:hypothetical protein